MKVTPTIKKEIERLMGINYMSPHAPPYGAKFGEPRCGDCFCIDQSVHTHSEDWYLELREKFISFIERL